jgi:hypothetical protein
VAFLLLFLLAQGHYAATVAAPPAESLEYPVKAAYIYNFSRFVEWPADGQRGSSVEICVFGEDPFGRALERAIANKSLNGRPLLVARIERLKDLRPCPILFVSSSEAERVGDVLAAIRGAPVLTVGESENFARLGGVVGFFLDGGRVRFEINLAAAADARLKISSQLLRVAAFVYNDRRGGP